MNHEPIAVQRNLTTLAMFIVAITMLTLVALVTRSWPLGFMLALVSLTLTMGGRV